MAGYSYCSSNEFPEPLTSKVARLEAQQQAHEKAQGEDREAIRDILKKMDHLMWGLITVLLAILGQILFKH